MFTTRTIATPLTEIEWPIYIYIVSGFLSSKELMNIQWLRKHVDHVLVDPDPALKNLLFIKIFHFNDFDGFCCRRTKLLCIHTPHPLLKWIICSDIHIILWLYILCCSNSIRIISRLKWILLTYFLYQITWCFIKYSCY